jgi:hypothetical protein
MHRNQTIGAKRELLFKDIGSEGAPHLGYWLFLFILSTIYTRSRLITFQYLFSPFSSQREWSWKLSAQDLLGGNKGENLSN